MNVCIYVDFVFWFDIMYFIWWMKFVFVVNELFEDDNENNDDLMSKLESEEENILEIIEFWNGKLMRKW